MSTIQPTMKLVTAPWQNGSSFRLIPVSKDCPFAEGIYDPTSKILVLMSVIKKETLHMMPKLDENGDPLKSRVRQNGKQYKEERKSLETFTEHYISEKEEIEEIIKEHAVNADKFDFKKYMVDPSIIVPEKKSKLIKM